jgi:hypothetical protein
MPLVSGRVESWAIVDVAVEVSPLRRSRLVKHGFKVPDPVFVRALIDTGSFMTAFAPSVFQQLSLQPVAVMDVLTPSTPIASPHQASFYDVSLSLIAGGSLHPMSSMRVMEADCWHPDEGIIALIGMDILSRCTFQLFGPDRQFTLSF